MSRTYMPDVIGGPSMWTIEADSPSVVARGSYPSPVRRCGDRMFPKWGPLAGGLGSSSPN